MTTKRLFDLLLAIPGMVLLIPLFVLVSLLIKIEGPGPVFFRQERIGRAGVPFKIYKFRTMVPDAESLGSRITVGRDPRITRVGCVLREYKLDELPQLINVLRGEMSLVGPRPEVAEYISHYSQQDKKIIHSLLPGITDPASIEFRNEAELLSAAVDPEEVYIREILPLKLEMYKRYVRDRSLWLDCRLILKTLSILWR